ncbi:MAG TPA: SRPBCC family protein, partial [Burkholderiales bacterium]|nr:SRPBCC family protein [Burkholderiales bacterium]
LGALAMYFLDPQQGRRRRARTRDKAVHASRVLNEAGKVTARDTVHRAKGVWMSTRKLFDHESVGDDVLVERVRAELGRFVSHSHAVEVAAEGGHVTLSGPILADEVRPLLRHVRRVPGVRAVSDRLSVHEDGAGVSALQGGQPAPGSRFELMQENWSPAARLAVGSFGASLMATAYRVRGTGACALLALAGGTLVARAATNKKLSLLLGIADPADGIVVQKTINVDAPVEEVFAFWTDYQNFPRFMRNVREVQVHEDTSHWVVAGPAGVPVQWNARLEEIVPNELIKWRSTRESSVKHEGWVRFEANRHGGSRITIRLCYVPPGGAFGHAVAALFGADPKSEMDSDLLRMKTIIETGRVPHDAARPASRES